MTARIFSIQGKTRVIRIYERIGDEVLSLWERAERVVFSRALVRESTKRLEISLTWPSAILSRRERTRSTNSFTYG
jgi:hypothetical protein